VDFASLLVGGSLRKYRRSALHMLSLARAPKNGQVQLPRGCSISGSSTPSSSSPHQWQSQVALPLRAAAAQAVVAAKALLRMLYARLSETAEAPLHRRFPKKWYRLQGLE